MDVELPDQRGFGTALVGAVEKGQVAESAVDRAVRRVLRQKIELGLLDPDWDPRPPCAPARSTWTSRSTANSRTRSPSRALCC
jgi:beta-glucosidase